MPKLGGTTGNKPLVPIWDGGFFLSFFKINPLIDRTTPAKSKHDLVSAVNTICLSKKNFFGADMVP
jgi:hypothetical protein